jgi:hypothetical protein
VNIRVFRGENKNNLKTICESLRNLRISLAVCSKVKKIDNDAGDLSEKKIAYFGYFAMR